MSLALGLTKPSCTMHREIHCPSLTETVCSLTREQNGLFISWTLFHIEWTEKSHGIAPELCNNFMDWPTSHEVPVQCFSFYFIKTKLPHNLGSWPCPLCCQHVPFHAVGSTGQGCSGVGKDITFAIWTRPVPCWTALRTAPGLSSYHLCAPPSNSLPSGTLQESVLFLLKGLPPFLTDQSYRSEVRVSSSCKHGYWSPLTQA